MTNASLSIGWFCPTQGDTRAFGDPSTDIPPSIEHFTKVAQAADDAGFEYMLIPVSPYCWDAWVTASQLAAATKSLKMLVAIKPGFISPVAQARMINTFDQFTKGRLYLNLIAGFSDEDAYSEGQHRSKEQRYKQLIEEVEILKALWKNEGPVEYQGEFHQVHGPMINPGLPFQKPHPPFVLGGGSQQAAEISAEHSKVHLFWGDYPAKIAEEIKALKNLSTRYDRDQPLEFAMRLQIIVRDTEEEAWAAADQLIADADHTFINSVQARLSTSEANRRQQELSKTVGRKLTPHLWTGITEVRPGAGIAVVGNPQQVADQLMEFVDAGCSGFCLSGYPHHEEAERFGKLVMPLLR